MATKVKENVFDKAAKHMGKKTDKKADKPAKKDKKVEKKSKKADKKVEKASKKLAKKVERTAAPKRVCLVLKCRKLDKNAKGRVRLNTMVDVNTLRNMQKLMAEKQCSIPTLLDQAFGQMGFGKPAKSGK